MKYNFRRLIILLVLPLPFLVYHTIEWRRQRLESQILGSLPKDYFGAQAGLPPAEYQTAFEVDDTFRSRLAYACRTLLGFRTVSFVRLGLGQSQSVPWDRLEQLPELRYVDISANAHEAEQDATSSGVSLDGLLSLRRLRGFAYRGTIPVVLSDNSTIPQITSVLLQEQDIPRNCSVTFPELRWIFHSRELDGPATRSILPTVELQRIDPTRHWSPWDSQLGGDQH